MFYKFICRWVSTPIHGFTKEVNMLLRFPFWVSWVMRFHWFIYLLMLLFFSAAYSCSLELCMNSNSERKLKYIDYFMHRINLLRHHKITPVVVFDGGNVPCKAATAEERHRHVSTIPVCFSPSYYYFLFKPCSCY